MEIPYDLKLVQICTGHHQRHYHRKENHTCNLATNNQFTKTHEQFQQAPPQNIKKY